MLPGATTRSGGHRGLFLLALGLAAKVTTPSQPEGGDGLPGVA